MFVSTGKQWFGWMEGIDQKYDQCIESTIDPTRYEQNIISTDAEAGAIQVPKVIDWSALKDRCKQGADEVEAHCDASSIENPLELFNFEDALIERQAWKMLGKMRFRLEMGVDITCRFSRPTWRCSRISTMLSISDYGLFPSGEVTGSQ